MTANGWYVRQGSSLERMAPMSKTLAPSTVTHRDPKGRKFFSVAEAAYDKADLTEKEAQRVNDAPGLADVIDSFIAQHRHEVPPILKLVAKGLKVSGAKRFTADKASLKEAKIGWTGDNFDAHFLGKVEENVADDKLAVHRLEKRSVDGPIRKELGQECEEITLAHFFGLLGEQSMGQTGHLLVNGYANIAYIQDKQGKLWAVNARWNSGGRYWRVFAFSVGNPDPWLADGQILSRDC